MATEVVQQTEPSAAILTRSPAELPLLPAKISKREQSPLDSLVLYSSSGRAVDAVPC
jgi:hypothetical protein